MESVPPNAANNALLEAFRKLPIFADLQPEQLEWLAAHAVEFRLEPGEILTREGDPADNLFVIFDGEIHFRKESAGEASPTYIGRAGQVGGMLPYSRLTHSPGTARAVRPARMARISASLFPEMLQLIPQLGQRLVGVMSDRIRESTRLNMQQDKMTALGKLSAGLAHELNNPSAAIGRAAAGLRAAMDTLRQVSLRASRRTLTCEQLDLIDEFEEKVHRQAAQANALDIVARSDREEQILTWLEQRTIADGWQISGPLSEAGISVEALEHFAGHIGEATGDVLLRIAWRFSAYHLVLEIEGAAKRISDLVGAVKEYSHMDQVAVQEVDIHRGLESTLTMFNHQLKEGIRVVRDYDQGLPKICANGGELNQVWTNLIDNAIDAMHGKGELRLRTANEGARVLVEVGDDGPGIPAEIQSRIFEPFFTTKGVGEGTGLGLDAVYRIVGQHDGDVRVQSKPGDTRFQVRLPLARPKTSGETPIGGP
jgi:signal transduction histidine kinase